MRVIFGIFVLLHSLVHLLYFGHSAGFFKLKPGLSWPSGAWSFSRVLGDSTTRNLASVLLILAAVALFASGVGILTNQAWWRPVVLGAVSFSTLVYILFWNGRTQNLDGQGLIGILINIAIAFAILVFRWPR